MKNPRNYEQGLKKPSFIPWFFKEFSYDSADDILVVGKIRGTRTLEAQLMRISLLWDIHILYTTRKFLLEVSLLAPAGGRIITNPLIIPPPSPLS